MDNRQRRLIAAAVLVISVLIVGYLVFLTPSEQSIPTPTAGNSQPGDLVITQLPSKPEDDAKRTQEALSAGKELTPNLDTTDGKPEATPRPMAPAPGWMTRIPVEPINAVCPDSPARTVGVASSSELTEALADAQPGDRIVLAAGTYDGNFDLSASGEQGKRIWVCGPRTAIIDGGDAASGYGLRISGSRAGVWGITISNALQGILVDGGNFVQIDNVEVTGSGASGIRFFHGASDGTVQDSAIHYTGLTEPRQGEGISVGSAASDWASTNGGNPDKSDRVTIVRNRIWDTPAEAIDLKEGTSGGSIMFNSFDGSGMTEADSWVDVKGNGYTLNSNVGNSAPEDGFQTHRVGDLDSGSNNVFIGNNAQVNSAGYGFYIQDPDQTGNVVSCTNFVSKAESGFSNVACQNPS